ncbi:hypothetical protein [Pseudobutyrivibrio xylanivorans]|uniref:Uncharacterized protein n=1 Tax=Pseudobutyrivibrio xylanivorans TaxID=185007 RepID=A0A5P6VMD1_PSEXY|nr:hypothetical protein [Pseudobutyrivibrio xylanivorans]QFJ53826.1 hypothetical protein FXF36_02560 [Pseudobutyrivibrio xylanivorans]
MINKIVETYKALVGTGQYYYEEEIFTKLEDAFIVNMKDTTGFSLIHGLRSIVNYNNTISGTSGKCELGDIEIRMKDDANYPDTFRRVFLQFKVKDKKGNKFNIPISQDDLYSCTGFDSDCVYNGTKSLNKANAMFTVINKDELIFGNCESFKKIIGCKSSKYRTRLLQPTGISILLSSSPYTYDYCSYTNSLEKFLENMRDMKVGEELKRSRTLGPIDVTGTGSIEDNTYLGPARVLVAIDVSKLNN